MQVNDLSMKSYPNPCAAGDGYFSRSRGKAMHKEGNAEQEALKAAAEAHRFWKELLEGEGWDWE